MLAHRVSGRRSVRAWGTIHKDGSSTEAREETWHVPGSAKTLTFDDVMIQRHLGALTAICAKLATTAREFAENSQPEK